MKNQVTKYTALFWFAVAAVWLLTFFLDFLNPKPQFFLCLFHGGCAVACIIAGIVTRIRYKKQKEEAGE